MHIDTGGPRGCQCGVSPFRKTFHTEKMGTFSSAARLLVALCLLERLLSFHLLRAPAKWKKCKSLLKSQTGEGKTAGLMQIALEAYSRS